MGRKQLFEANQSEFSLSAFVDDEKEVEEEENDL